jgi:hypothetical protein
MGQNERKMMRFIMPARAIVVPLTVTILFLVLVPGARNASGQCSAIPSDMWENHLGYPSDRLYSGLDSDDSPRWAKLTIMLCDPDRVYFQDSLEYPFHYHFAVEFLEPFIGFSREQFDQATLYETEQQAVLGAVIVAPEAPATDPPEVGIQLIRNDPFSADEVVSYVQLVMASLVSDHQLRAVYLPTYEQREAAERDRDQLLAYGIEVDDLSRWTRDPGVYSEGWAVGELVFVRGDEIDGRYLDGSLRPDTILLTDAVPSEIPQLAGVLTMEPSTPSSHVAILAKTFAIPFVHLTPKLADQAMGLVGEDVVLLAHKPGRWDPWDRPVQLIPIADVLTPAQRAELLGLKAPPDLDISEMEVFGSIAASTDTLTRADICYFGGKASNYGTLRRAIPDSSPVALAISFDLFNAFLDQTLSSGTVLRQEIADRLEPYSYPPEIADLAAELEEIRDLFADDTLTSFSSGQEATVLAALQQPELGFDPERLLRFRSSTNVEDSEHFTGAGLYDSFSGCLADDLDDDDDGPSLCDPTRGRERGVFRALRRVFASFYNQNAYLERLRYGVDESSVGMAVLVHHSFPDEIELANGVATATTSPDGTGISLVTQAGAVSVANPEPGIKPEIVRVWVSSTGTVGSVVQEQGSDLVILGASVLDWEQDYRTLADLILAVKDQYAAETGKHTFILDLEYKKVAPDGQLIIKQLRELPPPAVPAGLDQVYLINQPTEYCAAPTDLMASPLHFVRNKVRARFSTSSMLLTEDNLEQGLIDSIELDYVGDCRLRTWQGQSTRLPGHSYTLAAGVPTLGWRFEDLANPRTYRLKVHSLGQLPGTLPVITTRNLRSMELEIVSDEPVISCWGGRCDEVTTTTVYLTPCLPLNDDDANELPATFGEPGGVQATADYSEYWPPVCAGCVPAIAGFRESVITNLSAEPIVLHGYFSQSVFAGHPGPFWIALDPWLEPGLPSEQLIPLLGADVRLVVGIGPHLHLMTGIGECHNRFPSAPRRVEGRLDP